MDFVCYFKNNEWYNGSKYTCLVTSGMINQRNQRMTPIKIFHQQGKTNNDVNGIHFFSHNLKLEYFPRDLHRLFPNLDAISIASCGLKELRRKDLKGLENVENITISRNNLVSLPLDLFADMPRLRWISFNESSLEFVDSKMFASLRHQLLRLDIGIKGPGPCYCIDGILAKIDREFRKPPDNNNFNLFASLWSSRFSDFTIIVHGKEFKVHRNVLGMQSSVFAAMFENDMEESQTGRVTIHDFEPGPVEEFIRYLYTRESPGEENAMEVFALAAKYDVANLKSTCEKIVVDNIDETNAIAVLTLGNLYESEDMMSEAFDEIKFHHCDLKLGNNLKRKPENIKELIRAKQQCEEDVREIKRKYDDKMKSLRGSPI